MEGLGFFSICCCCTLMCKDEEWMLRHNTLRKAAMPISLAFHSLTDKQKVCAVNSAGSLSQSQTSAFKAREKTQKAEWSCYIEFKSWDSAWFILVFSIALGLCYCQHVLRHKGLVFPNRNWPSSPFCCSSSPGGFKLLLPNSPLKFHLISSHTVKLSLVLL